MYMCVHMCAWSQRTTSTDFRLLNKVSLAWNSLISPDWPITRSHDQSFSACTTSSWTLWGSGNQTDPHNLQGKYVSNCLSSSEISFCVWYEVRVEINSPRHCSIVYWNQLSKHVGSALDSVHTGCGTLIYVSWHQYQSLLLFFWTDTVVTPDLLSPTVQGSKCFQWYS